MGARIELEIGVWC